MTDCDILPQIITTSHNSLMIKIAFYLIELEIMMCGLEHKFKIPSHPFLLYFSRSDFSKPFKQFCHRRAFHLTEGGCGAVSNPSNLSVQNSWSCVFICKSI